MSVRAGQYNSTDGSGIDPRTTAPGSESAWYFLRRDVKSNKSDRNDAEAICEAVSPPSMRFVPAKTQAQQEVRVLQRVRAAATRSRPSH
jgi:transposase